MAQSYTFAGRNSTPRFAQQLDGEENAGSEVESSARRNRKQFPLTKLAISRRIATADPRTTEDSRIYHTIFYDEGDRDAPIGNKYKKVKGAIDRHPELQRVGLRDCDLPFIYELCDVKEGRDAHYTRNNTRRGGKRNAKTADALIDAGLAVGKTAAQRNPANDDAANDNIGQSIIRRTPFLDEITGDYRPPHADGPRVVIRGKDGNDKPFRENAAANKRCRLLNNWHDEKTQYRLPPPYDAPMRAIMNEQWGRGGRFYGKGHSWQGYGAAVRGQMTMGGEGVCEYDYKAQHPTMLYERLGLVPPDDCYSSGRLGEFNRGHAKIAMVCAIGAFGQTQAMRALNQAFWRKKKKGLFVGDTWSHAADLIEALAETHKPIENCLFKGLALELQFEDSIIAETVIEMSLAQGFFVYPVHDSFMAPASKADALRDVMLEAAERCGYPGLRVERK